MGRSAMEYNTPWVVCFNKRPEATLRLFCFHYGGGSASAFREWGQQLPSEVELLAIQLPGREGRFIDTFYPDVHDMMPDLVDAITPYLDKPYVVFGHSLGTINSFEWIREIKRRNVRQPLLYIPAGMSAPQFPIDDPPISGLPEDEFVSELLKDYGNTLKVLVEQKELREIFLPQLRADFNLLEKYRFREGPKLDCPILAFAGEEEDEIGEDELSGWAEQTNGAFNSLRFPGDHFFIHQSEKEVLQSISSELNKIIEIV